MSADFDSDLQRGLEGLSSDTGHVGLPGPAAARRRARQRTRNQATGAVLGAVAIVASGVFAFAQPTLSSAPDPADTPTGTVTASPSTSPPTSPSPNPTAEVVALPESVLLTVEDIDDDSTGWQQVGEPAAPWTCAPAAPAAADDRQVLRRSFGTADSRLDQIIEASSPDDAVARFEEIRSGVTACVDALGDSYGFGWISAFDGLGDDAWQASYFAPPRNGDEATLVRVDLVRTGLAVTSVASGGFAMDDNYPPEWDRAAAATTRLCEAAAGACVTQVERELLYPEGAQDLAGWLTADDVAEMTGLSEITQATEAFPREDGSLGFVCFEQNALASGARSVLGRAYVDPMDPGGLTVEQVVALFPTGEEGLAYYEALAAEGDGCNVEPDIAVQNTGADAPGPQDAPGFTTWRVTSTSTGSTWVLGLAVSGPVVTFVSYGVQPGHDVSADQMQALLERAVVRYTNP